MFYLSDVVDLFYLIFTSEPVRIDPDGKLYAVDYYGNYDSLLIRLPYKLIRPVRNAGCSCLAARDSEGRPLAGRNLDLPHFTKDGTATGLNVVLRCAPKGGYKSIAIADAADISLLGVPYYGGSLDDPGTDRRYLALLPYICMDGVNEKGLFVSVLDLDTKAGEHPVYQNEKWHEAVLISVLLRKMLDHCATLEETVTYAGGVNLVNTFGHEFQLFVVDGSGRSGVLDWRYNELRLTRTDLATNFYVSAGDAEDCYLNGELKERFVPPADSKGYRFGYGHGYERFKTMMDMIGRHKTGGAAVMAPEEVMDVLQAVSQEYTGELTSMTQYSAVYSVSERGLEVCVYPEYKRKYGFLLEK